MTSSSWLQQVRQGNFFSHCLGSPCKSLLWLFARQTWLCQYWTKMPVSWVILQLAKTHRHEIIVYCMYPRVFATILWFQLSNLFHNVCLATPRDASHNDCDLQWPVVSTQAILAQARYLNLGKNPKHTRSLYYFAKCMQTQLLSLAFGCHLARVWNLDTWEACASIHGQYRIDTSIQYINPDKVEPMAGLPF